tara:strand:- start:101 stop:286 length:186 start_codon:yes stop_codon:yes gene_type:complete
MGMFPKLSEIKEQIASWSPVARLVFFIILFTPVLILLEPVIDEILMVISWMIDDILDWFPF